MRKTMLSWLLFTTPCVAQDLAEELAAARELAFDQEWELAFESLAKLSARDVPLEQREQIATAYELLGQDLIGVGRIDDAVRAYERALADSRRVHGDRDHPAITRLLSSVGFWLLRLGRPADALPPFEEALAMVRRLDSEPAALASCLNNVAYSLMLLGRAGQAMPHFEEALELQSRISGEGDDATTALMENNLARCLAAVSRVNEALPRFQRVLAVRQRLYAGRDHVDLAASFGDVATCLARLGRADDALPLYESALAMVRRLVGGRDDREVAIALSNLGACLRAAGRPRESLQACQEALAVHERLVGGSDHPDVANAITEVATSLKSAGSLGEARDHYERALAMHRRLYPDGDHPSIAHDLLMIGACFELAGRPGDALPRCELALAMHRRLFGDGDHFATAASIDSVGVSLLSLGRAKDALAAFEQSLAMRQRLLRGDDHTEIAMSLNNVAMCLLRLGRAGDALPRLEAALAMHRRQSAGGDSPEVASSLVNVASCLEALDRPTDALPLYEESLAMCERIHGERDPAAVVPALNGIGSCLASLGRLDDALERLRTALAAVERRGSAAPRPGALTVRVNTASVLSKLGRTREALDTIREAVVAIEQLRHDSRVSGMLRQSFFDELKRGRAFERLQHCAVQLGEPAIAYDAAERSRSRELLDVLEQQRFDAFDEAARRARQRGDSSTAARLAALKQELAAVEFSIDRALLDVASDAEQLGRERRRLLDERARLLGDVLPVGRVRTPGEIGAALRDGELLLEYTITAEIGVLYVLDGTGKVDALVLPTAHRTLTRELPDLLAGIAKAPITMARGREPGEVPAAAGRLDVASRELFQSLIPPALWPRISSSKRVFIAAHRELHNLPFEVLATDVADGRVVHWLESGPPIVYVPSGSALHWLRQRAAEVSDDATSFDLLVVGDPRQLGAEPEVPEHGVLLLAVADGEGGAGAGLRPRDVLLRYDGQPLADGRRLRELLAIVEAAVEDGAHADQPIPVQVWRRGETMDLQVPKGRLGIEFAASGARAAHDATLGTEGRVQAILRDGDLERLRELPPLRGARIETAAIEAVFAREKRTTRTLLGAAATEPAVFELAPKAKFLHFACHGVAEEYAGQSLSMLVLAQPDVVLPHEDGLLKLGELLGEWGGRLASSRLVVLSACRTNVGPTFRDDAPQALPLGFLFAGAPAVISSLWAVDDESTRVLMTDFYDRLLAGETDKLKAFTDAKKALRVKYPDPFHWAPFLYVGAPD